jgi:hypothetical protein
MRQWTLIEPFETDDGTLEGVDAKDAFVFGVEWARLAEKLRNGRPFVMLCHPENVGRIVRMVERHGRFVEHSPFVTPGWVKVVVGNQIAP